MLLTLLLLIPLVGIFIILTTTYKFDAEHDSISVYDFEPVGVPVKNFPHTSRYDLDYVLVENHFTYPNLLKVFVNNNLNPYYNSKRAKIIALITSIINLFVSFIVFIFFNFSCNQFQFVQEYHKINSFDFYLGVDGISIYFVLLTTIIMPIALLSN